MGDIMKYDKIINVAIGKSRKELNYVNLKLPYSEFIDKYIKNTKYTKVHGGGAKQLLRRPCARLTNIL